VPDFFKYGGPVWYKRGVGNLAFTFENLYFTRMNTFGSKQMENNKLTRMWADAQHDGRPVEYRWRPLFNAAVWLTPTILECRAVMLPRRETR